MVYELKADSVKLLEEEMRLLLRDILRFTPPTKTPKADETQLNARQRGTTAVENDLYRNARPLIPEQIEIPRLSEAVARRDVTAIRAIVKNLKGKWGDRTLLVGTAELAQAHLRNRNRWGRVKGDKRNMAFARDWQKYARTIKQRVGWHKAGWLRAARALGMPLPRWIARHESYAPGGYYAPSTSNLVIQSSTRAVKIPDYEARHVTPAVKARMKSLVSEVSRLVKGGKSRRLSLANTPTGQAG